MVERITETEFTIGLTGEECDSVLLQHSLSPLIKHTIIHCFAHHARDQSMSTFFVLSILWFEIVNFSRMVVVLRLGSYSIKPIRGLYEYTNTPLSWAIPLLIYLSTDGLRLSLPCC